MLIEKMTLKQNFKAMRERKPWGYLGAQHSWLHLGCRKATIAGMEGRQEKMENEVEVRAHSVGS